MASNDTRTYWAKIAHRYRERKKAQDPAFLAHRSAQNRAHYVCTRNLPDQKLKAQRARKAINVSNIFVLHFFHPQTIVYISY